MNAGSHLMPGYTSYVELPRLVSHSLEKMVIFASRLTFLILGSKLLIIKDHQCSLWLLCGFSRCIRDSVMEPTL